jgi:dUTP pyrophosphatase
MTDQTLKIRRLHPEAKLPKRMTPGSAGLDLFARLDKPAMFAFGCRHLIPTGISVEIPPGYEGQIRPRSGLAAKHGITVLNSPGTIDSDYRGELMVLLVCLGENPGNVWSIHDGDRIAQLVIVPVALLPIVEVDETSETERGSGGFGSTG